jgi:hypothetical protein
MWHCSVASRSPSDHPTVALLRKDFMLAGLSLASDADCDQLASYVMIDYQGGSACQLASFYCSWRQPEGRCGTWKGMLGQS